MDVRELNAGTSFAYVLSSDFSILIKRQALMNMGGWVGRDVDPFFFFTGLGLSDRARCVQQCTSNEVYKACEVLRIWFGERRGVCSCVCVSRTFFEQWKHIAYDRCVISRFVRLSRRSPLLLLFLVLDSSETLHIVPS